MKSYFNKPSCARTIQVNTTFPKLNIRWWITYFLESNTKIIDNKPMPCYIRNLDIIKSMQVRSDDTFVIGCPKSVNKNIHQYFRNSFLSNQIFETGTTWVEETTWLLNNNLDYARWRNEINMKRIPFIDRCLSDLFLSQLYSPRTFKSHLELKYLPDNLQNRAKVTKLKFSFGSIQLTLE